MTDLCGRPNDKIYIAEEWLQLEREVLKKRPLTTGTVQEVRTAYDTISTILKPQYPPIESYQVNESKIPCNVFPAIN
jgi:hypothetical protein